MATLRDIKRRITSVKSMQQITRAIKLAAALGAGAWGAIAGQGREIRVRGRAR